MLGPKLSEWRKLPLSLTELCIDTTLRCGQSFRWRKINDEWHLALHGRILSLKQDDTHLHYKATWPTIGPTASSKKRSSPSIKEEGKQQEETMSGISPAAAGEDDTESLIKHYFSLKHNAAALYEQWSLNDANFRQKAPQFTGIRILSQDAWEALIGFICSSNNNISRISQMVHKLCSHYGPLIAHIGDKPFHDFPTPQSLAGKKVEAHLRELGFGYRAKYIAETARIVAEEKPADWLESLTNPENPGWDFIVAAEGKSGKSLERASYKEAHEELLSLSGVGPKVADCVCLMGLGWGEAVPVDTHVWQIAQRDYKLGGVKAKTFSKVMYDAVGDHFRKIWGEQAGWAQSVLFTANLKSFSDRKTTTKRGAALVKSDVDGIKVEVKEEVMLGPNATMKTKRKRRVLGETVKVEELPIDGKRRRTRSSMAK